MRSLFGNVEEVRSRLGDVEVRSLFGGLGKCDRFYCFY
ncbi:hypothetical protein B6N60_04391 [Richelia sinica FACHB-800]|uniref:Uncharacterized protein n=1 Tax=Richelia sinica FACHB-800 TaxID=1357546 RepID=A0A975TBC6_9NOST|nr:hypothetical protein B6N60_04391 [Richelia sinica FACHB-800]